MWMCMSLDSRIFTAVAFWDILGWLEQAQAQADGLGVW